MGYFVVCFDVNFNRGGTDMVIFLDTRSKKTLLKVISIWGEEHQWGKIAEECVEFLDAFFHWKKGNEGEYDHMRRELADLILTSLQGRIMGDSVVIDSYLNDAMKKLKQETQKKLGDETMMLELNTVMQKLDILIGQSEELELAASGAVKTANAIAIEAEQLKKELQEFVNKYTDDLK